MDYKDYVVLDKAYLRPEELNVLKGDSSPIQNDLGWKPEYNFQTLLDEMIAYWTKKYE
jgi:GDPmannose 4,6-dehydratase